MVGFNNSYNHRIEPSNLGEDFTPDSKVAFVLQGKKVSGIVTKQLNNSAVVQIDKKPDTRELVFQTNGLMVVNYRKLEKI